MRNGSYTSPVTHSRCSNTANLRATATTVFGQTIEQKEPAVFPNRVEIIRGTERHYENAITPTAVYAQTVKQEEPKAFFGCVEIISGTQRQCENVPQTTVFAQTSVSGSVRGERDARKDLASGHFVQFEYGLPVPWSSEFDQCLQRYGIEGHWGEDFFIDGVDPSTGLELSYYQSYDATSAAAIKNKFGSHVFDRCVDTARKKCEPGTQNPNRK